MHKLNIAIIYGGDSSEHQISIKSASTILQNICPEKYNIFLIYIKPDGTWLIYDGPQTTNLLSIDWDIFGNQLCFLPNKGYCCVCKIIKNKLDPVYLDLVFPVLHGKNGEDGVLQGLFESCKIPYVGCNVLASSIGIHKHISKLLVQSIEIPQVPFLFYTKNDFDFQIAKSEIENNIFYPCFVKPCSCGSSIGINKVQTPSDLESAINCAFSYDSNILIEKYIDARELECAALDFDDTTKISCVGEIISDFEFYDFDAKYNNPNSKTIVPANIPQNISDNIKLYAIKIFKTFKCSGLSRIDFFLEKNTNKIYFNEINTFPGFTEISMYPMLWEHENITKKDILDKLISFSYNKLNK